MRRMILNLSILSLFLVLLQGVAWSECAYTSGGGGQEGFTNDAGICIDMVHRQVYLLEVQCLDHDFNQVIWRGRPRAGDFIDTLGCNAIRVKAYTRRQKPSEELFEGCVVMYTPIMLGDGHRSRQGPRSEHKDWDFSLVNQRDGFCGQPADPSGYLVHPESGASKSGRTDSDEAFVVSLYRNILDREPDASGLRHWLGWLKKGKSRQWVMERFFDSREYKSRGKNDREFIRDFYQATRFREPTDSEMRAALEQLSRGASRADFVAKSGHTDHQAVRKTAIKLFDKVAQKSSSEFKANKCNDVRVDTNQWDRTPYHLTRPFKGQVVIPRGASVFLSSDPNKRTSISVDNFIIIGFSSSAGSGEFVIGQHHPVYMNNRRITKLGPSGFRQNLELTKKLPQGATVNLWAYALDYGGVGSLSDVYLIVE